MPQTYCPNCDVPIRPRVRFSIVAAVFLLGFLALSGVVMAIVDRPHQGTVLMVGLLTWSALVMAWWLRSPWVVNQTQ